MLYTFAALVALTISLLVLFVAQLAPNRSPGVARQLAELRRAGKGSQREELRRMRVERLGMLLQSLGERVTGNKRRDQSGGRIFLAQAGYLVPTALPIYWGTRIGLAMAAPVAASLVFPLLGFSLTSSVIAAIWAALVGWIMPVFYVGRRVKRRQKQIQQALPDALDMMVVCVEAGLALNQALVRVAQEIDEVSPLLSEQMVLVNLEIRAGTSREEALRKFAERTGVPEVSSLVAMLIQTDKFGTSVANALRVQASTLRTKRRQRAEEAAAKTAIKLVFPLVFFIFPAL
ncbi:MAG: type II secretion system F family protein, partial [Gemmatimonadales bacterium]